MSLSKSFFFHLKSLTPLRRPPSLLRHPEEAAAESHRLKRQIRRFPPACYSPPAISRQRALLLLQLSFPIIRRPCYALSRVRVSSSSRSRSKRKKMVREAVSLATSSKSGSLARGESKMTFARSISELPKKDFESLKKERDDNEPEPKRRGRLSTKNIFRRTVGRPLAERTDSDFLSDATLANARENGHWSNFVPDPLRK